MKDEIATLIDLFKRLTSKERRVVVRFITAILKERTDCLSRQDSVLFH